MAVRGKIYIVPKADEKVWQVVVQNTGKDAFATTQNVLPPNEPHRKQHDDMNNYGHGLLVGPNNVSWLKFHKDDAYLGQYAIQPGCHLRLGIRGLATKTIELPELDAAPIVIDLKDFNWYGGSPESARAQANSSPGRRGQTQNDQNGDVLLKQIEALINAKTENSARCEGKISITAIKDQGGALSHWNVRFDNEGEQPFVGTCKFERSEKNDGLGLEGMAVPNKNSAAVQRIEYLGDYGVTASPGEVLRLGVRGYATATLKLPADGTIELPIQKMKRQTSQMSDEFFDRQKVLEKRDEKRDKVQFFENGKPINDALKPKVWKGAEARARATFDAPELKLMPVDDGKHTPGGGWVLSLSSGLPEFDDKGRVGFCGGRQTRGRKSRERECSATSAEETSVPGSFGPLVYSSRPRSGWCESRTWC